MKRRRDGARRRGKAMKYMIMLYASQHDYDAMTGQATPAWTGEQLAAMGGFMESFHQELVKSGELVDAQGLTAPVHARRVQSKGGVPVVTDGPYPETSEVLAGYTIVECDSFDRATEIGARMAACPPGPGGAEGNYLDIRPIVDGRGELEI
jgi:hypothetical protein